MKTRKTKQNGYVLLAVISILTVAAAIAALATSNARLDASISRANIDSAQVRSAIPTALSRAIFLLDQPGGLVADGRVLEFEIYPIRYRVRLLDDRGLVSLNGADATLLERLIDQYAPTDTDAGALAAAILDWRDADSDPRPSGAEARTYANHGLPPPGNRAFVHVAELRRVVGMTNATYAALAPMLSVTSRQVRPDPVYAPLAILQILELSPSELARILDARDFGETIELNPAVSIHQPDQPEITTPDTTTPDTIKDMQSKPNRIFRAFVEVATENGARRAERLRVRLNPDNGQYHLYGRQVINYGSIDVLFEEKPKP